MNHPLNDKKVLKFCSYFHFHFLTIVSLPPFSISHPNHHHPPSSPSKWSELLEFVKIRRKEGVDMVHMNNDNLRCCLSLPTRTSGRSFAPTLSSCVSVVLRWNSSAKNTTSSPAKLPITCTAPHVTGFLGANKMSSNDTNKIAIAAKIMVCNSKFHISITYQEPQNTNK